MFIPGLGSTDLGHRVLETVQVQLSSYAESTPSLLADTINNKGENTQVKDGVKMPRKIEGT